jgi:hypothetical protein
MGTPDVLRSSVQQTHDHLAARLERAAAMASTPDQPRKAFEAIDTFLAAASKHLGAVDAVLLPVARRRLPDGSHLVHDYLHAARGLELALAHVKARAYGSTFEAGHSWQAVWRDVSDAMARQRSSESVLADQLSGAVAAGDLDDLTERLYRSESTAPSRPHPYTPHTGFPGLVARKVMRVVDSFWDTAEGRMSPAPSRPQRRRPGLIAQYFLADPRFDEEGPPPRGNGSAGPPA